MATYDEMRAAAFEAWKSVAEPPRPLFVVSINTSSIAAGAEATFDALRRISEDGGGFDVMRTGDTGLSWAEPVVQVMKRDASSVLYGNVSADVTDAFAAAATAGIDKERAVGVLGDTGAESIPALRELDWMKLQVRWLMRDCGVIDPENIDHYIALGGYGHFLEATKMERDALIDVIKGSTLRGHSGSFFSTGMKWQFLKDATREPKYLVCNADEGDPGAWVNRVIMESDPHLLLEGMLIGAYATGATFGWIYIRDEYPLAIERVNRAIAQCRERGIFGEDALGTGVRFDAKVIRGAGAYVCGDETGLISSVNDERGMPRLKPPFPAQAGVLGQPTNVNNVETYPCVTVLLREGPEKFSTVGTEINRGTKMFTVSGAAAKTGCLEVPFGTTVDEVLAAAGGIADGRSFKALHEGGPLSGLLPADVAGPLPLEKEPFVPLGAGMGGGGLVFVDDTACIVDLNVMVAEFLEDESCGRCTTCRGGNQRMVEIFRRTTRGEGSSDDVPRLQSLATTMVNSNCLHGGLSPTIMNHMVNYFREEYDAHVVESRCPAKVCADLIRYRVMSQSPAVAAAAEACPTRAIVQADGGWQIDDAACIRCNVCKELAPDDIAVEDRYADTIPLRTLVPADVARSG